MKRTPVLIMLMVFLFSCTGRKHGHNTNENGSATISENPEDHFQKSAVIPSVSCYSDSSFSYALYLPHQYNDTGNVRLPVLFFFDPHGNGALPLNLYKEHAEQFGVILMGSNNLKNGMDFRQTEAIAQTLLGEVKSRFGADTKQISVAGFSGGAKAALVAGMNLPGFLTVIYCGAGLQPRQISNMPPALGFAGYHDLNYTEVIQTDEALGQMQIPHALVQWSGKHEWVSPDVFKDAFCWMHFRAAEKHLEKKDEALVKAFMDANSKPLKNPLDEWARLKKLISFLNGSADISNHVSAHESLINRSDFKAAIEKLKNDLMTEGRMKQNYFECIARKDLSWWNEEVRRLEQEKGEKESMNQRLLGYISLACYSVANAAINQGDWDAAQKALAVYKLTDPANPDQPYLAACLYARTGEHAKALASLEESIIMGLKEKGRIENEPSFSSLRGIKEFQNLLR